MRTAARLLVVWLGLGLAGAGPVQAQPAGDEAEDRAKDAAEDAAEDTAEDAAKSGPAELDEPFEPPPGLDEPFEPPPGLDEAAPAAAAGGLSLPEVDRLELRWGGRIQTDIRFQIEPKSIGLSYDFADHTYYQENQLETGIRRNENIFKLKLDALYGRFAGVVDIDFVWLGQPFEVAGIDDLTLRNRVDSYYFEAHAAYIEATDLIVDGLDLRVGQQLVQWGKADQFNPTNNLNSEDLEDVLLFGQQLANVMARLDYQVPIFMDNLHSTVLSAVLVPIFKPALLVRSAPLGLALTDRLPFASSSLRYQLHTEKAFTANMGWPTLTTSVEPRLPDESFDNMQYAFRLATTLFGQDVAFSYYRGREDIPQPVRNHTVQLAEPFCRRGDPDDCVQGLLQTEATVAFPRIQVVGFNMAGEIPLDWIDDALGGIGYRFELGVYFPQELRMVLDQEELNIGIVQPAGEYDYDGDGEPGGPRPVVIDDEPFAKWTLGLDYSFGPHAMLNLMWVHGMVDDFGAGGFFGDGVVVRDGGVRDHDPDELQGCVIQDRLLGTRECGPRYAREIVRPRIGDYLVLGLDFKFADDRALLRLFGILELTPYYEDRYDEQEGRRVREYLDMFGDGLSMALFPEFNYNFGNGFELGCGALIYLGKNYTKFGDPAAGGSFVFTRARYTY
jgi:hypothetical protein